MADAAIGRQSCDVDNAHCGRRPEGGVSRVGDTVDVCPPMELRAWFGSNAWAVPGEVLVSEGADVTLQGEAALGAEWGCLLRS
jgi:hypothetical protein